MSPDPGTGLGLRGPGARGRSARRGCPLPRSPRQVIAAVSVSTLAGSSTVEAVMHEMLPPVLRAAARDRDRSGARHPLSSGLRPAAPGTHRRAGSDSKPVVPPVDSALACVHSPVCAVNAYMCAWSPPTSGQGAMGGWWPWRQVTPRVAQEDGNAITKEPLAGDRRVAGRTADGNGPDRCRGPEPRGWPGRQAAAL